MDNNMKNNLMFNQLIIITTYFSITTNKNIVRKHRSNDESKKSGGLYLGDIIRPILDVLMGKIGAKKMCENRLRLML